MPSPVVKYMSRLFPTENVFDGFCYTSAVDSKILRVNRTMFWRYQVFNITANGTNFLIKDLNLEGDYREHVYTNFYNSENQIISHEFGYGIFIQGNGRVENCHISYMTGDAIVIKNSSEYNGLNGSGSGGGHHY